VLQFLLEHGHFWNIDISQGSVATQGVMEELNTICCKFIAEFANERIWKIG